MPRDLADSECLLRVESRRCAARKSCRLLSAKCGAQALGHTVELLPRHRILCCARRVWDDVKVDVADVLPARIILLDREAGRTKSTLLSGTDLPGDKESMTHLGWRHVEQAPHGPLRDDERMPRMIPLQRQQHDHLSIFVNPRCRQLTSKDAGERVVLLIRLVERTAQSWRGGCLWWRRACLRWSDCCQSRKERLHSHHLPPSEVPLHTPTNRQCSQSVVRRHPLQRPLKADFNLPCRSSRLKGACRASDQARPNCAAALHSAEFRGGQPFRL